MPRRNPTYAMARADARKLHAAQTTQSIAWSRAIDETPHRFDEPCGTILLRAAPELQAALDAANAEVERIKDHMLNRGTARLDSGRFITLA